MQVVGQTCDIVEAALARYYRVLVVERDAGLRGYRPHGGARAKEPWFTDAKFRGYLDELQIELTVPCETRPHMDMQEKCACGRLFWSTVLFGSKLY